MERSLMKKTSGLAECQSGLVFLWGKSDYTRTLSMVKVTFLLNNYGDIIAEQ